MAIPYLLDRFFKTRLLCTENSSDCCVENGEALEPSSGEHFGKVSLYFGVLFVVQPSYYDLPKGGGVISHHVTYGT